MKYLQQAVESRYYLMLIKIKEESTFLPVPGCASAGVRES